MRFSQGFVCAALAAFCALSSGDADACGGCFHPKAEQGSSVITDHRMVFSVSTERTILWDQVRYSGSPKEFAWVLPVRSGAVIELSRDEWMTALDRSTRSTVTGPERFCSGSFGGGGGSGGSYGGSPSGGGGCSGGSEDSYSAFGGSGDPSYADAGSSGSFQGNEDVEVVSQDVIGPYQAVTIHSKDGTGISGWLKDNGFAINDPEKPIIDSYTTEGFDFIALRLRPNVGVRAMRPVRVITPGADTSMPLRMVTAGVGSHVAITLWVIGEGRYETANFPSGKIDDSLLTWDGNASKSNLGSLETAKMAENAGRTWVVQASGRADLSTATNPYNTSGSRSLGETYESQCRSRPPVKVPCDDTSLPPSDGTPPPDQDPDAGAPDGGDMDADVDPDAGDADGGASGDGGTSDAGPACTKIVQGCDGFDDLDVAVLGLHPYDIWVTRLRADLPVQSLDTDLRIQAASVQAEVDPVHHTEKFSDPSYDPCKLSTQSSTSSSGVSVVTGSNGGGCACRSSRFGADLGTFLVIGTTILGLVGIAKRRRRF